MDSPQHHPDPSASKDEPAASQPEIPDHLLRKLRITVPGYELLNEIATGGQATVYRARELTSNLTVAIKILHAGPFADDSSRERFRRETAALKALNHPNIVCVIESGRTPVGLDYLVMNYIDGVPLDTLWTDRKFAAKIAPQPPARLRLFQKICTIVQAAHRKGITHRDLSPSNILLDSDGEPHILDFGLAATAFDALLSPTGQNITVTGQFIGKLKYASPEQAKGTRDSIDIRTDVYALGVILYQILTNGAYPYEVVGNVVDILNNIIHSKPTPPSAALSGTASTVSTGSPPSRRVKKDPPLVNEAIEAVVMKALEKDPARRYESAGAFAADIECYLEGKPASASPKRPDQNHVVKKSKRKFVTICAVVTAGCLFAGATMNPKVIASWLGLSAVLSSLGASLPPEIDPGVKLDAVRTNYELSVENIRVQIDKTLGEKEDTLRSKPGNDDAIDKIVEQRKTFAETGTVPPTLNAILRTYQDQRKILLAAYDTAHTEYRGAKVKLDALAKEMVNEAKTLREEDDLRPWSENVVEKLSIPQRSLDTATPTWTMPTLVTDPYRVEVVGKADAGAAVTIEVPTLDNKRVAFPAKLDSAGNFHIILTIRAGTTSIDLGVDRQIKPTDAGEGNAIGVRADGGKCTLEKVRVKSVQKMAVVAANLDKRVMQKDAVADEQPAPVMSVWKGKRLNGGKWYPYEGRIVGRTPNEIVFEAKGLTGGSLQRYTLRVTGKSLELIDLNVPEKPESHTTIRNSQGTISKNRLWFTWTGEVYINGKLALTGTGTIDLQPSPEP